MRRRRVLRTLSVAAAAIAGCASGPRKSGPKWGPPETEPDEPTEDRSTLEPTATTTAVGYGFETGFTTGTGADDGGFVVTVTVENTASVRRSATLVVTWGTGEEAETRERPVSLDPGERTEFEFTFPGVGNLAFDWKPP